MRLLLVVAQSSWLATCARGIHQQDEGCAHSRHVIRNTMMTFSLGVLLWFAEARLVLEVDDRLGSVVGRGEERNDTTHA